MTKGAVHRLILLLSFLVPLVVPTPGTADEKKIRDALKEFRRDVGNRNEHVRKAAVMGLFEISSPEIVDALLAAVGDPAPAVRNEVIEALGRQTDEASVARMVEVLGTRRGRKPSHVLALLESFRISRPAGVVDTVLALTGEKDGSFEVRLRVCDVLPLLPDGEAQRRDGLTAFLEAPEAVLRLSAVGGLRTMGAADLHDRMVALLEGDPDWRVRSAAIGALLEFRKKESIPVVIAAYRREKGRLRDDCQAALVALSGDAVPAKNPDDWEKWWNRVGDRFRMLTKKQWEEKQKKARAALFQYAKKPPPGYGGFVGIETQSQRILFLLDVSGSMAEKLPLETDDPAQLREFRKRYGDYERKIDLAREELIQTVAGLGPDVQFNIVTFHSDVKKWKKDLIPANPGNKNQAIRFLARLTPLSIEKTATATKQSGRTNTFDALNVAFGLAKKPVRRTSKNHKVRADTVFLVTDGMPTAGRIQEPEELLRYFGVLNRRAKLVVHCITFGHGNVTLLEPMARTSGGRYHVIELGGGG